MTNPFEAYAERAMPNPVRLRHVREEKREAAKLIKIDPSRPLMKLGPLEAKLFDQSKQLKVYRKFKKELRTGLLEKHGKDIANLVRLLRTLRFEAFQDVLKIVKKAKWLIDADMTTRLAVLGYISYAMMRARVRDGRPPFDDPLPGQPDDEFRIMRKLLTGV